MSFNNTLDTQYVDYSKRYENNDLEFIIKKEIITCLHNFFEQIQKHFNYSHKIRESFNNFSPLQNEIIQEEDTLINYILNTQNIVTKSKKDTVGCRLPDREPFLVEDETYNPAIAQLSKVLRIEFRNIPLEKIKYKDILNETLKDEPKIQEKDWEGVIEFLGLYYPRTNSSDPYIVFDINKISEYCEGDKQKIKNITSLVLIHELFHAAMDPNNYKNYIKSFNPVEVKPLKIEYSERYGCCKEEAYANALTMQIIKESGDEKLISDSEEFMKGQRGAYLYGYLLEKVGPIPGIHGWIKEKIDGSDKQVQQKWLESMIDKIKLYRSSNVK